MRTNKKENTAKNASTLLIGDAGGVFSYLPGHRNIAFERCKKLPEAMARVERGSFEKIFIVMSDFSIDLESAVARLGQASNGARIFLLAQMYEEPRARDLVRSAKKPANVVSDYFIRPADVNVLLGIDTRIATAQQPLHVIDTSDYKDARIRELEKLVTQDDLTDLKNRRYIREFLKQIIARSESEKLCVTLLLFDIDNFKHYNDTYGHAVGDNVLKQAAIMMRRCCRTHDVIGRIGGDEFAAVFWDPPARSSDTHERTEDPALASERRRKKDVWHPREALFLAERFRKEIGSTEHSFLGAKGRGILTISGGLASFPDDGETVQELFEQADQAMLEAKRSGKNRIYLVGEPD